MGALLKRSFIRFYYRVSNELSTQPEILRFLKEAKKWQKTGSVTQDFTLHTTKIIKIQWLSYATSQFSAIQLPEYTETPMPEFCDIENINSCLLYLCVNIFYNTDSGTPFCEGANPTIYASLVLYDFNLEDMVPVLEIAVPIYSHDLKIETIQREIYYVLSIFLQRLHGFSFYFQNLVFQFIHDTKKTPFFNHVWEYGIGFYESYKEVHLNKVKLNCTLLDLLGGIEDDKYRCKFTMHMIKSGKILLETYGKDLKHPLLK